MSCRSTTTPQSGSVCDRWLCSVGGASFPNRLDAGLRDAGGRDNSSRLPTTCRRPSAASTTRGPVGGGTRTTTSSPSRHPPRLSPEDIPSTCDRLRRPSHRRTPPHRRVGGDLPCRLDRPELRRPRGPAGSNDDHRRPTCARTGAVLRRLNVLPGARPGRRRSWSSRTTSTAVSSTTCSHQRSRRRPADLRSSGPRAPATASPPLPPRASHAVFDHTSIIKTSSRASAVGRAGRSSLWWSAWMRRTISQCSTKRTSRSPARATRPSEGSSPSSGAPRGVAAGGGRCTERGSAAGSRGPHRLSGGLHGRTRCRPRLDDAKRASGGGEGARDDRRVLEPGVAVEPLGQLSGPAERDVCRSTGVATRSTMACHGSRE